MTTTTNLRLERSPESSIGKKDACAMNHYGGKVHICATMEYTALNMTCETLKKASLSEVTQKMRSATRPAWRLRRLPCPTVASGKQVSFLGVVRHLEPRTRSAWVFLPVE